MRIGNWKLRSPITRADAKIKNQHAWLVEDEGCPSGYVRLSDCPEIQTPVNRIAELVSSMTLHLMENTPLGDVRVHNGLARAVDVEPSRDMNHKEFYYTIVKNMLLDGNGNAVVIPEHDAEGNLVNMRPCDMSLTSIMDNPDGRGYHILHGGRRYNPDEVLHFRANPDPHRPWAGTGYRVLLRDVAANLVQAQKTKKKFMASPTPSLIIKYDGLTDEFNSSEGRKKLADKYISDTETGAPWMVPADLIEVQEVRPFSLSDIAINENVTVDKRMAASIFGVPPYFAGVGDFDQAEYNAFVNIVIHSIAKIIQQEMTRKLIYGTNWYFKFNHRSLLAYDYKELIDGGGAMVDRMAMSRNEWRDSVGLSPLEHMEPLLGLENYIPVELLGQQKKLQFIAEEGGAR